MRRPVEARGGGRTRTGRQTPVLRHGTEHLAPRTHGNRTGARSGTAHGRHPARPAGLRDQRDRRRNDAEPQLVTARRAPAPADAAPSHPAPRAPGSSRPDPVPPRQRRCRPPVPRRGMMKEQEVGTRRCPRRRGPAHG